MCSMYMNRFNAIFFTLQLAMLLIPIFHFYKLLTDVPHDVNDDEEMDNSVQDAVNIRETYSTHITHKWQIKNWNNTIKIFCRDDALFSKYDCVCGKTFFSCRIYLFTLHRNQQYTTNYTYMFLYIQITNLNCGRSGAMIVVITRLEYHEGAVICHNVFY